ncbi:MAG: hypothetical protein ACM3SU_03775, partial [Acidobacteriota bacterium]
RPRNGSAMRGDFLHSCGPPPHRRRTARILAAHPEIRSLIGVNPFSLAVRLRCGGGPQECRKSPLIADPLRGREGAKAPFETDEKRTMLAALSQKESSRQCFYILHPA